MMMQALVKAIVTHQQDSPYSHLTDWSEDTLKQVKIVGHQRPGCMVQLQYSTQSFAQARPMQGTRKRTRHAQPAQ